MSEKAANVQRKTSEKLENYSTAQDYFKNDKKARLLRSKTYSNEEWLKT